MATVEIDTTKLQAALDGMTTLIGNVRSAASQASNDTPVPLPSLEGAELTGPLAWFEDQRTTTTPERRGPGMGGRHRR
jgi:hypothetical protein